MFAACFLAPLACAASVQEARPVESARRDLPLHNDCVLGFLPALQVEFAHGDERLAALPHPIAWDPAPPQALSEVFDAWHRALALGAEDLRALVAFPDELGGSARGGECAELALERRLAALGIPAQRAWRARFDALARGEFELCAREESALERFVERHACTRSAVLAALMLADLARERGDEQAAARALDCARRQSVLDDDLARALERRRPANTIAPGPPRALGMLEPQFTLQLPPSPVRESWTPPRRAGSALAELADGRLAWAAGPELWIVESDGKAREVDLGGLSHEPSWSWTAPFRDDSAPWNPTLVARGTRVAALLGRARAEGGNLLAAIDLARDAAPALAWAWSAAGVRVDAEAGAPALSAGLWEYQPGALERAGKLYVLAHRFAAAEDGSTAVDETRVESWCLALDFSDGALAWARLLGKGADPATRDPARRPDPRGTCSPGDPLALEQGRLWASNGLGWLSALELPDGRIASSWRAALDEGLPPVRALALPPAVSSASARWFPASDWSYRVTLGGALEVEPRRERNLLSETADSSWFLLPSGASSRVESKLAGAAAAAPGVELARAERVLAARTLADGELVVESDRALYRFEAAQGTRLRERVPLPPERIPGTSGSGALFASGDRLVVARGSVLASFRLR